MSPISKYYDRAALSEEELGKMAQLRDRVQGDVAESPDLQKWLTDITVLRYLRARGWNLDKAEEMLRKTIAWRKEMKPEHIRWADVREEASPGKLFVSRNKDRNGRNVLIMRPRNENSKDHAGNIRNLVYQMETICFLADEDDSVQITIVQDFEGYGMRNAPPMKTSRETLNILQAHYPERLKVALLFRAPTVFNFFWRAISPFIDPVTSKKIIFVEKGAKEVEIMSSHFDHTRLEPDFGGSGEPDFSLENFDKLMVEIDARRCPAV